MASDKPNWLDELIEKDREVARLREAIVGIAADAEDASAADIRAYCADALEMTLYELANKIAETNHDPGRD